MKRIILSLLFQFSICPAFSQSNIDVLHYQFHIDLNDTNDSIYGIAIIKFAVKEKSPAIQFDLTGIKKDGKGMIATVVGYKTTGGIEIVRQENEKLIIPSKFNKGDTAEVIINYKGIPSDGLIISKNKYGKRTFFSDNWPNRAHNWIPCNDDPADKASVEFIIVCPMHYQVISNGVLIEETNLSNGKKETHWQEDVALPTKVMVIGAADFAVNYVGDVNCIPVSSWVYPENRNEGFYDYAQAKDILSFFINYIGPFPYKKLANVQSKTIFGGMENAGAIFYSEESVTGKREEEDLLAHEIVHQWFGDMATEKSFSHLWLSEGFATYLSHIYLETKYGTEKLNELMIEDRDKVIDFVNASHKMVVDSVSPLMQLLNPNSYQKGGWILHMLRRELGDSVFKKCVRQYYSTYAGRNANTTDLKNVFESVSGKKLDKFFSQWLYGSVNPSLKFSWKYNAKEKKMQSTVQQVQSGTIFSFLLEVEITYADGKKIIKKIAVANQSEKVDWPVSARPVSVKLDPNVSLLFEGSINEMK